MSDKSWRKQFNWLFGLYDIVNDDTTLAMCMFETNANLILAAIEGQEQLSLEQKLAPIDYRTLRDYATDLERQAEKLQQRLTAIEALRGCECIDPGRPGFVRTPEHEGGYAGHVQGCEVGEFERAASQVEQLQGELALFRVEKAGSMQARAAGFWREITAREDEWAPRVGYFGGSSKAREGEFFKAYDLLTTTNKALREALAKYGAHTDFCLHNTWPVCTCGWDAALKATTPEATS